MAESPANRSRIVPIIMADHNDAPSATTATTTTPKLAPKPKSTTRKSTAVPKPTVSSARTTRSQTKSFGLDEINANLKTLEERGLYAFDTKGDGNCLYYALSDQMYGNWDHASEIRDNLAAHMKSNRDYFGGFAVASGGERRSKRAAPRRSRTPIATPSPTSTEFDDAFQELISRTATEYVWGGAEEIQAFCQYYKRDIRVYSEDHVQDFRASDAPEHEVREVLHLAYIKAVHYSSVRNIDGPHEGLPNVNPKAPSVVLDLETAQPWKIMCIQEGLGGQYDRDAIVEMLRRCRGDIDRAFAKLLDEESSSSTSSCVSSATSAASSQTSTATTASEREQQKHTGQPHGLNTAPPMANFKPRLMSSRSSSRHSTASKRSADDSDDEGGPISAVRQRGREQKRRILPKVTVGINIGDQEKPDLVSLRLRVNSDVVAERLSPTPSPSEPTEQPKPKLKQEERRKLRPRKPRSSVTSDADTASTISSESRVVKTKE